MKPSPDGITKKPLVLEVFVFFESLSMVLSYCHQFLINIFHKNHLFIIKTHLVNNNRQAWLLIILHFKTEICNSSIQQNFNWSWNYKYRYLRRDSQSRLLHRLASTKVNIIFLYNTAKSTNDINHWFHCMFYRAKNLLGRYIIYTCIYIIYWSVGSKIMKPLKIVVHCIWLFILNIFSI